MVKLTTDEGKELIRRYHEAADILESWQRLEDARTLRRTAGHINIRIVKGYQLQEASELSRFLKPSKPKAKAQNS